MRQDRPALMGPYLPPDYTPEEFEIYQEFGGGDFYIDDTSKIYLPLKDRPDLQFVISYCFENRHRLSHAARAMGVDNAIISRKQKQILEILAKHDDIKSLLTRH